MLCTSGFMDDVTFGRSGLYGDSGVVTPGRSLMSMNALLDMLRNERPLHILLCYCTFMPLDAVMTLQCSAE